MSTATTSLTESGGPSEALASVLRPAPLISVVVPAFNCERFLEATVRSIQDQTVVDWELIIVNDGATDGTSSLAEQLAEGDERIRVVHQKNGGLPNARNSGAAAAASGAPYITFLDADDLWLPDTLEVLSEALAKHPEWAGVHGLGEYMDDCGAAINRGELEQWCRTRLQVSETLTSRVLSSTTAPTTFEMLALRNYIATGTVLLRREEFEYAGRFDDRMKSLEDWHLWVRIALRKKIGFVDRVVFRYRRHDSNMSSNRRRMQKWQFLAAKDLYESAAMTQQQRKLFVRSQTVVCHLLWAAHDTRRGCLRDAAGHIGIAARNLIDYHLRPMLRRSR